MRRRLDDLLVAAAVVVPVFLMGLCTWTGLAGEPVELSSPPPPAPGHVAAPHFELAPHVRSLVASPPTHPPAAAHRGRASAAESAIPVRTIDGTLLAVLIIALLASVAVLVLLVLRRRIQQREHLQDMDRLVREDTADPAGSDDATADREGGPDSPMDLAGCEETAEDVDESAPPVASIGTTTAPALGWLDREFADLLAASARKVPTEVTRRVLFERPSPVDGEAASMAGQETSSASFGPTAGASHAGLVPAGPRGRPE